MYGENDSMKKFIPFIINEIKNNVPYIDLTEGDQKRDFIFVDDVVNAFEIVMNSCHRLPNYENFDVGTGKVTAIKDLIILIKSKLNSQTELRFGKINYRKNEIMFSKASNEKLVKLGWEIHYDLEKGISNVL